MNENYAWGIHAGQSGDADTLFLKETCIAIGWSKIGDLSKLHASREAFKAALIAKYPTTRPGAVTVISRPPLLVILRKLMSAC